MRRSTAAAVLFGLLLVPGGASAFCGFYVGGAESSLYNDATMVVMMRSGTRTVLSMQNSYQGPPERFAMVVPVPVVLQEDNVRTLDRAVFERVDRLAAPRLVEYWEQDPCHRPRLERRRRSAVPRPAPMASGAARGRSADLGVRIEAQFAVGEYDIVILSAQDSSGLDTWLRREGYSIPDGAEPALRPYVQAGTKFFVARVDPARVTFTNGRALLSPLRVHYDSETFSLPVRLGMINSAGTQDLIVHILAQNQRYEVANYPNVFVPTNVEVRNNVRGNFGAFYASLFDKTRELNPGAVVTEYAWQAGSCDPCPGPTLTASDIATLGGDVVGAQAAPAGRGRFAWNAAMQWTLTRLHHRYDRGGLDEDLVFRAAPAVAGGRGTPNRGGRMDREVTPSSINNFQGRYAILHWWPRAITCENPRRGVWGGPPNGAAPRAEAAMDLATQPRRPRELERYLRRPVPELSRPRRRGGGGGGAPAAPERTSWKLEPPAQPLAASATIAGCSASGGDAASLGVLGIVLALVARRVGRRRGIMADVDRRGLASRLAALAAISIALASGALASGGCDSVSSPARAQDGAPSIAPLLPSHGATFPQSQLRISDGDPRDVARLMDVETCGGCHPDVLEGWRSSAHARASMDNPWYRQAVDAFRAHAGNEQGRFCAGCHDPVLLVAGAVDTPIAPEDPRAHAGITCLVCHGMGEVRLDGSASYTISTRALFLPDPGNAESVAEHVRAVNPDALRTSQLCGSCHRGFLGPDMGNAQHLDAVDELSAWSRSAYAGSQAARIDEHVEQASCQGCHMPLRAAPRGDFAASADGRVRTHRFLGAHATMADAAEDEAQLREHQALLAEAARIDVAAARSPDRGALWLPADGAAVRAGETVELDVVVHNAGTGHRFPGGTIDTHDTWIEVEVRDADGTLIAEAGTRHAWRDDPEAHRLRALLVDPSADPEYRHHVQRFAAKITDHTIAPRDAEVARYLLEVPREVAFPLSVRARLRHRRHNRALVASACAAQRTERGQAFRETSRRLGNRPLDACRPQPITELAEARVEIGAGAREARSDVPRWRRLFDHALALIGDVQENLDEARPSLDAALEAAPDAHARAMILAQRARLEGRQSRVEAAIRDLDRAEELVGAHPAIARLRGDAYAQVWRWPQAVRAYRAAAEGAPLDDTRWTELSRALGSTGDDRGALLAARRGLALQPRDESLLRTQYLALDALGLPGADEARAAYVMHRSPDAIAELRLRCGQADAWCADERLPVRTHRLRPARR